MFRKLGRYCSYGTYRSIIRYRIYYQLKYRMVPSGTIVKGRGGTYLGGGEASVSKVYHTVSIQVRSSHLVDTAFAKTRVAQNEYFLGYGALKKDGKTIFSFHLNL